MAPTDDFVANTAEFTRVLDVLHAHKISIDSRRHVLRLCDEEVPLRCPGVRQHSGPSMKGKSDVAAARNGTLMAVRLEEPLGDGG
jgi:hypothetical protein